MKGYRNYHIIKTTPSFFINIYTKSMSFFRFHVFWFSNFISILLQVRWISHPNSWTTILMINIINLLYLHWLGFSWCDCIRLQIDACHFMFTFDELGPACVCAITISIMDIVFLPYLSCGRQSHHTRQINHHLSKKSEFLKYN